jgi:anti-sigma-K factor RskA
MLSDVALDEYLAANPEADRAALHDPQFAAEVARMRTVLDRLDTGLEAEGLDVEARRRIGVRLLADCLLTDEARERVQERHRLARELAGGALPAL